MSDLPEPFTPADCDLRGLEYMPLFGDRLFGSATWISAKPEAKIAALRLWWHSYSKELPAASLPDDDALLADYAGYGVAVVAWRKIKAAAMRGWVKCSDGRLYHKRVAEIALKSWEGRQESRKHNDRKRKEREERSRLFAELSQHEVTPPWNIPTGKLRDLHAKSVTCHVTGSVTSPGDMGVTSRVTVTAREGSEERGDKKETPPPPSSGEGRAAKAHAIKADWAPRDETRAYAAKLGFELWEIDAAATEFREYWLSRADKTSRRADWDLTFKTRLRDLADDPKQRAKLKLVQRGANTAASTPIDWKRRLALWRDHRDWYPDRWGPRPDEPGYLGPKIEDGSIDDMLTAQGGQR